MHWRNVFKIIIFFLFQLSLIFSYNTNGFQAEDSFNLYNRNNNENYCDKSVIYKYSSINCANRENYNYHKQPSWVGWNQIKSHSEKKSNSDWTWGNREVKNEDSKTDENLNSKIYWNDNKRKSKSIYENSEYDPYAYQSDSYRNPNNKFSYEWHDLKPSLSHLEENTDKFSHNFQISSHAHVAASNINHHYDHTNILENNNDYYYKQYAQAQKPKSTRKHLEYFSPQQDAYKKKGFRFEIHPGFIAAPLAGLAAFGVAHALSPNPVLFELGHINKKKLDVVQRPIWQTSTPTSINNQNTQLIYPVLKPTEMSIEESKPVWWNPFGGIIPRIGGSKLLRFMRRKDGSREYERD